MRSLFTKILCVYLLLFLSGCSTHSSHAAFFQFFIADKENLENVKTVFEEGYADINELYEWGTALALAAQYNRVDTVQYLIASGADINKGNVDGKASRSPLHSAAIKGSTETALLLLKVGANTTLTNRDNQTPAQLARSKGHQQLSELINEFVTAKSRWALVQQKNTSTAYADFIKAYPNSIYTEDARQWLERHKRQAERLAELERTLPPEILRDKYMVELSNLLKTQQYEAALPLFKKLTALPISTDPSLKFFYGEALLKTNQTAQGIDQLYQYINEQGRNATHYTTALTLISQAESQM